MKKVIVISTSLRAGSNSDMLAEKFAEGAKASGNEVEKIFPSWKGDQVLHRLSELPEDGCMCVQGRCA